MSMLSSRGGGVLYIFWVRGRAVGKGIDFHDFGIRNGINFHHFGIRNGVKEDVSSKFFKKNFFINFEILAERRSSIIIL